MRTEITMALCAGALLLAFRPPQHAAPTQDPARETLEERVDRLERSLAQARDLADKAQRELSKQSALLDQVVAYLGAQAKAADELTKTLDRSEAEGFTYGINPRSREILLTGWRAHLQQAQASLPGAKAAGSAEGASTSQAQR